MIMAAKKKNPIGPGHPKKSKNKRASSSKIANKKNNKLAKQGKLKNKQKSKEIYSQRSQSKNKTTNNSVNQTETPVNHEEEEILPLGEDDLSYYGTPGHNISFASTVKSSVLSSEKSGKKRKKDVDPETEADYEMLPRKLFSGDKNMKMILPIKTKRGIVRQMIEDEDIEEETEDQDEDHMTESHDEPTDQSEESHEPLPVLSNIELYALRQEKLLARKQKIAMLSGAIVENTEGNIKRLRELVTMLHEGDTDVFVTVRKYVIVSLLEVFKDIIPGYHIRSLSDKEQKQQMKKDTMEVLSHEEGLLRCYKQYLEFLEKTAKGDKPDLKKNKNGKLRVPEKAQTGLTELCVKCMCELLVRHSHFNYRNNIITVIVPYMNYRLPHIGDMVCTYVRQLFKEDKAGNVTLELTKCISKMVKARDYRVQTKVMESFMALKIKEVSYTDPLAMDEEKKKKTHNDKLSRRERKQKKHQMFLERDLSETKATEDRKKRLRLHTETIQSLFLTYFRILKMATNSVLLPCVLEGLAKFAHLISVDFFDDLFAVFNTLISSGDLSYRESLHCVQSAFTILSGQGSVLNIDPMVFYKHLYKNLFHIHAGSTCEDVPIVLECLDLMVSKRKRQISQQRVLSFMKRLSTLALQQSPGGTVALLAAIRSFMITYSYCDILLDNEAQGSGVYLPELDDPEHCHAHNATLWELVYLQRHIDPVVRRYAGHISRGAPMTGEGQLTADLRKQPLPLYEQFTKTEIFDKHLPEKTKQSKRKGRVNGLIQSDFQEEILTTLHTVGDVPDTMDVT